MGKLANPQQSSFDRFAAGTQRWLSLSQPQREDDDEERKRREREEAQRRAQATASSVGSSQQRQQREQWAQGRQPSAAKPGGVADYSYEAIAKRTPAFSGPDRIRNIQSYLDQRAKADQAAMRFQPGRVDTAGEMLAGQAISTLSGLPGAKGLRDIYSEVGFAPAIEAATGPLPEPRRGQVSGAEGAVRAIGSAGTGLVRGAVTMGGYAMQGIGQQSARLFGGEPEDYAAYRTGKEIVEEAKTRLANDEMFAAPGAAKWMAETIPEGVGSVAPFLVAGAVAAPIAAGSAMAGASAATAAKIATVSTYAAPAVLGYLIGAGATYDEALMRGLDEESAMAAANAAAPAYILESVPVAMWIGKLPMPLKREMLRAARKLATMPIQQAMRSPDVRRVVTSALVASGQGAGTEALQEYTTALTTEALIGSLDPEVGLSETLGENVARAATDPQVIQEGLVGGVVGAGFGGGERLMRLRNVEQRLAARATRQAQNKPSRDSVKAMEEARNLAVPVPGLEAIASPPEGEAEAQRPDNLPSYLADVDVDPERGALFTGQGRFMADAQVGEVGVQVLGQEGDTVIARMADDSVVAFPADRVGETSWYQQKMGQLYRREGRQDVALDFKRREPKTNQEREAFNIAKRMGVNLEFYENRVGGETHVGGLIRDGNTIGVNVTPGSDPVTRLVSHELTEAIRKQDPALFAEMSRGMEDAARREGRRYAEQAGEERFSLPQMAADIASNDDLLVKEGVARLMENADVIRSVGGPGVGVWRRFHALLKRVLASMRLGKNHRVVRKFNEAYRTLARREGQAADATAPQVRAAATQTTPTTPPITPAATQTAAPITQQEAQTNAQEVRSDSGQPEGTGQVRQQGQADRGGDVQQPAQARPEAGDAQAQPAREVEEAPPPDLLAVASVGDRVPLKIPTKPDVQVAYALAEVDDLTASHDEQSFQPRGRYSLKNTRPYDGDKTLQSEVIRRSKALDTDLLLSLGPTAQDGPSIVTPDGMALGGNGRLMSLTLAHKVEPAQFKKYNDALRERAADFGLSPDDVGPNTVLVRVVIEPGLGASDYQAMVGPLNRQESMAQSLEQLGDVLASELTEEDVAAIEVSEKETLTAAIKRQGVAIVDRLIRKGAISRNDRTQFVRQKSPKSSEELLKDDGAEIIERAILTRFVGDSNVVENMPETLRTALFNTLGPMLRIHNLATDGRLDSELDISASLPAVIEQVMARGRMFGEQSLIPTPQERKLNNWEEALVAFYQAAQGQRRAGIAARELGDRLTLGAKDTTSESQMFGDTEPFAPDLVKEIQGATVLLTPGVEYAPDGGGFQYRPAKAKEAFKATHTMKSTGEPVQSLGMALGRIVVRTTQNRVHVVKTSAVEAVGGEAKKPAAKAPEKKEAPKPGVVPEGLPESILVEGGSKTTVGDIAEFYINHPDVAEATKVALDELRAVVDAGVIAIIAPPKRYVKANIQRQKRTEKGGPGEWILVLRPKKGESAASIAQSLSHEMVHIATYDKLQTDKKFRSDVEALLNSVRETLARPDMAEFVDKYKKDAKDQAFVDVETGELTGRKWDRGLDNVEEFAAEAIANPLFQQMLDKIPSAKGSKVTAWEKLVQVLRSALGLKVSDSVLAETLEVLAKHVNPGNVVGVASTSTTAAVEPAATPRSPYTSTPKLPAHLSKEASRYGYQDKNYTLDWASDVDRAAYVVAKQGKKSKAHDEFLQWGTGVTGMTEAEFIAHGERVKALLKMEAAGGDPSKGPLRLAQLWYPPEAALQTGRRGLESGRKRMSSLFVGTITEDVFNPKDGNHIRLKEHIATVLDRMGADARDAVTGMPRDGQLPINIVLGKIIDAQTEKRLSGSWNGATATIEIDPTAPDFLGAIEHDAYHAAEDRVLSNEDVARIDRALKGTVNVDLAKATATVTDGTNYIKRLVDAVMADARLNDEARGRVLQAIATDPAERRAYGYQYYRDGKLDPNTIASRLYEYAVNVLASLKPFQVEAPVNLDTFWALASGQYRRPNPKVQRGIVVGLAEEIVKSMQRASSRSEASDSIFAPPRSPLRRAAERAASWSARWMLSTSVMGGTEFARSQSAVVAQKAVGAMERWALTRRLNRAMTKGSPLQREGMTMIVFGDVASRSAWADWNHPALRSLTEEQRNAALDMRHGVDALSKELLARGMPSEQVQSIVEERIGSYIARAYQLDHKPGWTHRVRVHKPKAWRDAVEHLAYVRRLKDAGFDWQEIADATEARGPQGEVQVSFLDEIVKPDEKMSAEERRRRRESAKENVFNQGVDLITGARSDRGDLPDKIFQKILKLRGKPLENQELENASGELYRYMRLRETKGMRGDGAHSIPLDRLRRRRDIPEVLREVWGEIKDPVAAADRTLHELNEMIARYDLFAAMAFARRDDGTRYAYDHGDPEAVKAGAIIQLGSRQGRKSIEPGRYGLLEGKWVTREVADQIDTIVQSSTGWLATVDRNISMPFKVAQTILSTGTHMRNTIGNATTFAIYAGVSPFNPLNSKYYLRALAALNGPDTVTGRILNEFAETALGKLMGAVKATGPTGQDYRLAAKDGALAKQFFAAPETQRLIRDSERIQGEWSKAWVDRLKIDPMAALTEPLTDNFIMRGGRGFVDWAKTLYMAEDQVFRLAAFFKRYDTNGGDTKDASDWVNLFFPDYSRIPLLVQALQKTPLVAPFLSFMAEMPRIHANLATHRPIMGLWLLFFWSALLSAFLDDEDDELFAKAKHLLPEYYRHNSLLAYRGADGRPRYINMDNVIPFLGFAGDMEKIGAVLGVGDGSRNPRSALLDYLGGGPLADIIAIAMLGTDTQGTRLVPGDASTSEVLRIMAGNTIQKYAPPLFPGVGYEYERLRRGVMGEVDKFGRTTSASDALVGVTTGVRPVQTQWDAAYMLRTREVIGNLSDRVNAQKRVLQNNPTAQQRGQIAKRLTELRADLLRAEAEMNESLLAALKMSGTGQLTSLASENYASARRQWRAKRTEIDNLIRAAVTGE